MNWNTHRSGEPPARMRFAFYGRVSTEDQQDPEASRAWQLSRSRALIEPAGGHVVEEFFDVGLSRSLPWKRRPQATRLLAALRDPRRGFEAVVIGEPQRAFYGNQFGLTFPLFEHYAVGLWVPEVGGAVDPGSDAHDLVMALYGGMSKGERNRIKVRVRSAMAAQAATEGRFLGGSPTATASPTPAHTPTPQKQPTADGCTASNPTHSPQTSSDASTPSTSPDTASSPSPKDSPATASSPPRPTTRAATHTAPPPRGAKAPSGSSSPTPATPAGRSGTSNARPRSSSTSTTSPSDTKPNNAGTPATNGSTPQPWPTNPSSTTTLSTAPRP